MNVWLVASIVLLAALVPCVGVCLFAHDTAALAALQVGSMVLTTVLLVLSEGLHRQPFVDLAVTFALVSLVGSIAFARVMEEEI